MFRDYRMVLLPVLALLIIGCSGGGDESRGQLVIGEIEGSSSVEENAFADYTISASGDSGITYSWAVDPPSSGSLVNQTSSKVEFHPVKVEADTEITIRVVVNSDSSDPLAASKDVEIKDIVPPGQGNAPLAQAHVDSSLVPTWKEFAVYNDSTDPDDDIVSWEWDFHFNNESGFDPESEDREPTVLYKSPDIYLIQLRATDSIGNEDMLASPLQISVVVSEIPVVLVALDPPIQYRDDQVHFYDDGSYDPDGGDIIKYEWDWDADGVFDEEGADVYHSWDTIGTHTVGCRVTDDDGSTGTVEDGLEIQIIYPCQVDFDWAYSWGGDYADYGADIELDDWGNIYVSGRYSYQVDFDPGEGVDFHNTWCVHCAGSYVSKFDPTGSYAWARTWGNSWEFTSAMSVATDSAGNVYACGEFAGDMDFDPGDGILEISAPNRGSGYLTKFDSLGEHLWAVGWWGTDALPGASVLAYRTSVDSFGNVYVLGQFSKNVDFDPGPSTEYRTSNGKMDVYLSKFGPDGQFLWVRSFGAEGHDTAGQIGFDDSGNTYIEGTIYYMVDFDPGPAKDIHGNWNGASTYVCKFDPSGNYLWGTAWGISRGGGMGVSDSGLIYVTGWFEDSVDFDPGPGLEQRTSNGAGDVFLSCLDSDGTFQWVQTWGGVDGDSGTAIAVDNIGHVYCFGRFASLADFDPGPGIDEHEPPGKSASLFACRFDSMGQYEWVVTLGGRENEVVNDAICDADNNILFTGGFTSTVDFDPTVGITILKANDQAYVYGIYDAFLAKYLP